MLRSGSWLRNSLFFGKGLSSLGFRYKSIGLLSQSYNCSYVFSKRSAHSAGPFYGSIVVIVVVVVVVLGTLQGASWGPIGVLKPSCGHLGTILGSSWASVGFSMRFGIGRGATSAVLGPSWRHLGAVLDPSWAPLGPLLAPSWPPLTSSLRFLRPSWGPCGVMWGSLSKES